MFYHGQFWSTCNTNNLPVGTCNQLVFMFIELHDLASWSLLIRTSRVIRLYINHLFSCEFKAYLKTHVCDVKITCHAMFIYL